jgi:glycosyltransferase involved in cell wall biosynthesis
MGRLFGGFPDARQAPQAAPAGEPTAPPLGSARRDGPDAPVDILAVNRVSFFGGAERVILTAAAAAATHGWKTTLACPPGELAQQAQASGLPVRPIEVCSLSRTQMGLSPRRWTHSVQQLRRARRAILELAEASHARILHIHHPVVAVQAAPAARACRIPLIWHVHETAPMDLGYRILGEAAVSAADMIIGVSEASCEMVRALGAPEARIRRIYNAAAPQFFDRIEPAEGPFGDGPNIGAFGVLEPRKGHADLIRACARLTTSWPGLQLWIVGGISFKHHARLPDDLRALARELGVADRVHLLGRRDDIPQLMARMDAVVSASIASESLPTVLVEACAAGRPVLGTDVGGTREIIRNGVTGLLTRPGHPEELAGALNILLSPVGRGMGERARADAQLRFSLSRFAADLDGCYGDLVDARRERRA